MTHTPGPWKVYDDGELWVGPVDADAPVVCDMRPSGEELIYSLQDDANAHLIAAAPDLLDALQLVLDVDEWRLAAVVLNKVHAAIAKAEGR